VWARAVPGGGEGEVFRCRGWDECTQKIEGGREGERELCVVLSNDPV
jgi:hypothetical protein